MPRTWTPEQKQAAAERMKQAQAKRWANQKQQNEEVAPIVIAERPPEVQAVIDAMTPERKAKLAGIQARNLAKMAETKEGREALQRLEEKKLSQTRMDTVREVMFKDAGPAIEPIDIGTSEAPFSTVVPEVKVEWKPQVLEVPMKSPFRITGSTSGLCVSELGPCQCGEPKLKWHPICLKVKVRG